MKKLVFASLLIFCTGAYAFPRTVENLLVPGYASNSLDDLDGRLKKKIEKLIKNMESKGYDVEVSDTHRSKERQVFIYEASKLKSKILKNDAVVTTTTNSRHNRTVNGEPAACAVDLRPAGNNTIEKQAEFYKVLLAESKKLGLSSGANFKKKKSSPFYEYGLGYDPGHIYMRSCK